MKSKLPLVNILNEGLCSRDRVASRIPRRYVRKIQPRGFIATVTALSPRVTLCDRPPEQAQAGTLKSLGSFPFTDALRPAADYVAYPGIAACCALRWIGKVK